MQDVIRMTYDVALCHPDDITSFESKSSGWVSSWSYLIWMTCGPCIMSSGSLSWCWYLIRMSYDTFSMSSGWHALQLLSHPDDICFLLMSSGWLNWGLYLIRISYSEIHYHNLGHLDEIVHFEFSEHVVALQCIHTFVISPTQIFSYKTRYPDMAHTRKSMEQSTWDCVLLSQSMTYSFGMFYVYRKDYLHCKRLHHYEIFRLSWLLCHSLTVKALCEHVYVHWQLGKWQLLANCFMSWSHVVWNQGP